MADTPRHDGRYCRRAALEVFDEDCVYLMGGEPSHPSDVIDYPDLGKTYALIRGAGRTAFHALGPAEYPFGSPGAAAEAASAWRVFGCRGCGSTIVEAVLVLAGIAYEREEIDYTQPGPARDRLLAHNPLGQPAGTL